MNQILPEFLGYNLSNDPETKGFDLQAGQTWIYPTNYPIRDYQFNIIQKALLKNTLVSLPTGLGKTFIAAVVMYNFFRWYPLGKVIFMAPTRPLVKQQIDACYDIMAIPKDVTVELTGSKLANSREDIWKDKRVFFITPQILQNDLDKLAELGPKIKCLVFDEAHRARGNHAYCEVMRKLIVHNNFFRVLALSATPGSNIGDVSEVVENLLISHLEFRTEESVDVQPYVYERNLTTVVVPLGQMLQKVKDDYIQILEYYTRTLVKYNVIQGNCGNLTKGKIFITMKEFQQKGRNSGSPNYAEIMKSLNVCVTLYHAFELLIRHGLRSFLSFFDEHIDKPLLRGNTRLIEIMNGIREYLGPEPNIEQLPDGSYPKIPETTKFGHPKFYKLRDILLSHITEASESSRVIVFFEYRNSVIEAYALLFQSRPILKPRIFLGQGHGVTQRVQLNVIKSFREGECNILLSTCIGEEGLDVGDVDLIVCFDISTKSPIRMVQRMGRTGRKKKGKIIVLVTEGKEQQVLKDCLIHKNNIAFHVLSSKELAKRLTYSSPRLVPTEISPKCEKIYITVKKPLLTKNSSLKDMFRNISSSSSEPTFSPDLEIVNIQEKIPKSQTLWNKGNPLDKDFLVSNIFFKRIEKQRSLQPIQLVKHSEDSKLLVKLLQLVDSKRFNIPESQIGSSQLTQNRNLKQTDIRNMFLKSQGANDVVLESQGNKMNGIFQEKENPLFASNELLTEVSNYLAIRMSIVNKKCKHCPNNIDCSMHNISLPETPFNWNPIDDSVLDTITTEDINLFAQSLTSNSEELDNDFGFKDSDIFDNIKITQLEKVINRNINSDLHNKQLKEYFDDSNIDTDVPFGDKSVAYQAPKNLDSVLSKYSTSIVETSKGIDKKNNYSDVKHNSNKLNNTIEIDDEIFQFFKFKSLVEMFVCENVDNESLETIIYSPDIFDNTIMRECKPIPIEDKTGNLKKSEDELSPVLCTFERVRNLKNVQKNIFNESFQNNCIQKQTKPITTPMRPNLQNLKLHEKMGINNEVDTPSKFAINITKLNSTPIAKTIKENSISNSNPTKAGSIFDITNLQSKNTEIDELSSANEKNIGNNLDVDDICDLSIFGISETKPSGISLTSDVSLNPFENEKKIAENQTISRDFSKIISLSNSFDVNDFCDLTTFGMSQENKKVNSKHKPTENVIIASDSRTSNTMSINEKLDSLFGKPRNKIGSTTNNNLHEVIIGHPSSSKHSLSTQINKSYSQSQMPITQLLNLVNKDDQIVNKRITVSQRDNCESNTNSILKNDLDLFYQNCSSSNKNNDLLTTKKQFSSKTSKLSMPANQVEKIPSLNKTCLNKSFSSESSDDDFEKQNHAFRKPLNSKINGGNKKITKPLRMINKKKNTNIYIDDEAEVSIDENTNISEDEEDRDQDMYEISFIADETQHIDTQTHARYLQSLKSPRKNSRFKSPLKQRLEVNVYSQEVNQEDDTYLDDTFVVHDEIEPTQHELSELEILEQKLKEIKKKKRKKSEDITEPAKRRRIIQISSDDSD